MTAGRGGLEDVERVLTDNIDAANKMTWAWSSRRASTLRVGSIPDSASNLGSMPCVVGTWCDPDLGRPIAAPLQQCAELLGVDLAAIGAAAADVEPYLRADGTQVWSLMQLERQLRPEAYDGRRGGYLDRRRTPQ